MGRGTGNKDNFSEVFGVRRGQIAKQEISEDASFSPKGAPSSDVAAKRRLVLVKVGPAFDQGIASLRNTMSATYTENMLQASAPGYQKHTRLGDHLVEFDVFSNSEADATKQFEDVCSAMKESGSVVNVRPA